MARTDRRTFLRDTATVALAGRFAGRAFAQAPSSAARSGATLLDQFEYGEVQLLDGPTLEQFRQNHVLFLNLSEDSLLKPFRQAAGMPAPGEDMGGWYSPSSRFDPPKEMTGYIPGHSFGQYVSGLSRAYAVTRDRATQAKVQRLVDGFAPTVTTKFLRGVLHPGVHLRQDDVRAD